MPKTHLGQLGGGSEARKIFGGIHAEGPTIRFGTNDCFASVLIIRSGEEVKDPVSQNKGPFNFDCKILDKQPNVNLKSGKAERIGAYGKGEHYSFLASIFHQHCLHKGSAGKRLGTFGTLQDRKITQMVDNVIIVRLGREYVTRDLGGTILPLRSANLV